MPLNRTPPLSTHAPTTSNIARTLSEPHISGDSVAISEFLDSSTPKLAFRNIKRKRSESDGDFNYFITELRQMFHDLKAEQSSKIDKLCSAIEDMRSSVSFLADKYESLLSKCDKLESERNDDLKYIQLLEDKIESLECHSRSTCAEIRNIPVNAGETKDQLINTVVNTGKALNVDIQRHEIKDVFRIRTKTPNNKTLIVNFSSVIMKEKLISAHRKFNRGKTKLTTEHLKIGGVSKPIFISENLTFKMKRIFFLARDYAKSNGFAFCWVSHGKIYIRKREGDPLIRIASESDLTKLQK